MIIKLLFGFGEMLALTTKYAIKSLKFLAQQDPDRFIQVKKLASELDIPAPYLSKVMKALGTAGIIATRRGATGGVKLLSQHCKSLTLYEVCVALEDPIVTQQCMLSKQACSKIKPCVFHKRWTVVRTGLLEFLKDSKL